MKTEFKRLLAFICLLLLLGPTVIDAKCKCGKPPADQAPTEKIYLDAEKIDISDKQILIKLEQEAIATHALYTDNQGIYVLAKRGRDQGRCPEEYWECGTCSGCSPWHTAECDWCGYN